MQNLSLVGFVFFIFWSSRKTEEAMDAQMNVGMAIEILSGSPIFSKYYPRREKVRLAREYCKEWEAIAADQKNEKEKKSN